MACSMNVDRVGGSVGLPEKNGEGVQDHGQPAQPLWQSLSYHTPALCVCTHTSTHAQFHVATCGHVATRGHEADAPASGGILKPHEIERE